MNKPSLNKIATIINSVFFDSEYEGKNWESVRKSLIESLNDLEKQAIREFFKELDWTLYEYGGMCVNDFDVKELFKQKYGEELFPKEEK